MTDFERKLHRWAAPPPASGLAERIARQAMHTPQGWRFSWRDTALRSVTEWRYGLPYKAAALAACLLIGVGLSVGGMHEAAQAEAELEELAFIVGI